MKFLLSAALYATLSSNAFLFRPDDGADVATGASAFDSTPPTTDADAGGDDADDASSGATSTAVGTTSGTETDAKATTKEEVLPNMQLVTLLTTYDELKDKTVSVYVDMAELIGKDNLSRPVVVQSIMKARGITYENAQPIASRIMKLAKDPETIQAIRDGKITTSEVFYNRKPGGSKVGSSPGGQTDPANVGGGAKGTTQAETKEKKYARVLGEFIEVCKSAGYDRKAILMGVEASLKNAGIK